MESSDHHSVDCHPLSGKLLLMSQASFKMLIHDSTPRISSNQSDRGFQTMKIVIHALRVIISSSIFAHSISLSCCQRIELNILKMTNNSVELAEIEAMCNRTLSKITNLWTNDHEITTGRFQSLTKRLLNPSKDYHPPKASLLSNSSMNHRELGRKSLGKGKLCPNHEL
jgi:hypothetical protein